SERIAKRRTLTNTVRARIDVRMPAGLFAPRRNQSPPHLRQLALTVLGEPNHGNGFGRPDVVARTKVLGLEFPRESVNRLINAVGVDDGGASAHCRIVVMGL